MKTIYTIWQGHRPVIKQTGSLHYVVSTNTMTQGATPHFFERRAYAEIVSEYLMFINPMYDLSVEQSTIDL